MRNKINEKTQAVLDWEISVPDWPTGGMYAQRSLEIAIIHHTDISLSDFGFFHSEQDINKKFRHGMPPHESQYISSTLNIVYRKLKVVKVPIFCIRKLKGYIMYKFF